MAVATDPLAERARLLDEQRKARVSQDTARGKRAEAEQRRKQASDDRFRAEMDRAIGAKGAEERERDAAERERAATADEERHERAFEAAGQAVRAAEARIGFLYHEGFDAFADEAQRKSEEVVQKAELVRAALAEFRQAWDDAAAHWQRLGQALITRIEEDDIAQGRRRDKSTVVRECQVPPFPVQTTDELLTRPPVPPAVQRLTDQPK